MFDVIEKTTHKPGEESSAQRNTPDIRFNARLCPLHERARSCVQDKGSVTPSVHQNSFALSGKNHFCSENACETIASFLWMCTMPVSHVRCEDCLLSGDDGIRGECWRYQVLFIFLF